MFCGFQEYSRYTDAPKWEVIQVSHSFWNSSYQPATDLGSIQKHSYSMAEWNMTWENELHYDSDKTESDIQVCLKLLEFTPKPSNYIYILPHLLCIHCKYGIDHFNYLEWIMMRNA